MEPVSTAIIGLGYWGPNLLRNFAALPECNLTHACDLSEATIAKTRAHYPALQYTTSIEDIATNPAIELVLIATPTTSHFPIAKRLLEAGKHVFVEKPMTSTSEEASELVAIAKEKGLQLFVDHTFMFAPAVEQIHDLALNGVLGDLLYFDSVRINLGLIQQDANVLQDLAIHDLSILSTICNLQDILTVSAHGTKHFGSQEENAHLHLLFKNGFSAHIHVSWLSPVKIRKTILAGTKAMVMYDDIEPSEKIRVYDRGVEHDTTRPEPFWPAYRAGDIRIPALPSKETLMIEAVHVLKCVRGIEKPRSPGSEGLLVLRILERATQSMKEGGQPLAL